MRSSDSFFAILKKSAIVLVIRGSGTIAMFALSLFAARWYGASSAGEFFLSLNVLMISSLICRFGLDRIMLRHISADLATGNQSNARSVYVSSILFVTLFSLSLSVLLSINTSVISETIFSSNSLDTQLNWFVAAIIPFSILIANADVCRAVGYVAIGSVFEMFLVPTSTILTTYLLTDLSSIDSLSSSFFYSSLIVSILSICLVLAFLRPKPSDFNFSLLKNLLSESRHLSAVNILNSITQHSSSFILAANTSPYYVGLFGASYRVANSISTALSTVNNVVPRRFSALHSQGKFAELKTLVKRSTAISLSLALPAFLLVVLFPSKILSFFGPEFSSGATTLVILAIGQFANAASGSVGYLLITSGHSMILSRISLLSSIATIILASTLVLKWGVIGAAIATSAGTVLQFLMGMIAVKRYLGFWTSPFTKN